LSELVAPTVTEADLSQSSTPCFQPIFGGQRD
jgi:hypothetical protein